MVAEKIPFFLKFHSSFLGLRCNFFTLSFPSGLKKDGNHGVEALVSWETVMIGNDVSSCNKEINNNGNNTGSLTILLAIKAGAKGKHQSKAGKSFQREMVEMVERDMKM